MLTATAITELTVETGTAAVFLEWLTQWFDGNLHQVGLEDPARFPLAVIAFDESPAVQPNAQPTTAAANVEIRLIRHAKNETNTPSVDATYAGNLARDLVQYHFWISAKKPGPGQSALLSQQVAQLLKAILTNPDARIELAEKGLMNVKPRGPASSIADGVYAKKLLAVDLELNYPVRYGDPQPGGVSPAALDVSGTLVPFLLETNCLVGGYLLGDYTFAQTVMPTYARAFGFGSVGADTVFELEVAGALTGKQVRLSAVGASGIEQSGELNVSGVSVAAGQPVRWKIVAGAAAVEQAAWRVSLQLRVK